MYAIVYGNDGLLYTRKIDLMFKQLRKLPVSNLKYSFIIAVCKLGKTGVYGFKIKQVTVFSNFFFKGSIEIRFHLE